MKKIKYVSFDEINDLLAYAKKYTVITEGKKDNIQDFNTTSYFEDNRVEFILSLKKGKKGYEYHFRKDCLEFIKPLTGADAYRILSQYYKVPVIDNINEEISARPFMYFNKKYERQRVHAYGYDLNSAYSYAMLQEMPDTTQKTGENRIVKIDELGFKETIKTTFEGAIVSDLVLVFPGYRADIIFKKMPSPFENFVKNWYNRKKNAKNPIEKAKAKGVLNYSIGFLQRRNPYIRATIISRCNNLIKSLMDKDTLYCNTDSLVSLKKRDDIEKLLGSNVGDWKLEHEGEFAYIGFSYQWNLEKPSYRGVPTSWFPENYDILKDGIPTFGNVYSFDRKTFQMIKEDK